MDCEQMLRLIHHYLDGGLPQWRQRAISRHIVECPPCAGEHRFHIHYREVVATKCSEDVPPMVRSRICEALVTSDSSGHLTSLSAIELTRQTGGGDLDVE